MAVFDLKQAVVTLLDGSGSPNTLAIKVGEGTFSYTETFERVYKKDRGKLYKVVNGDDTPVAINFDLIWEYIKADVALPPSPVDFMKKINNASTYVSTDSGDPCGPFAIDIKVVFTPACIAEKTEQIYFAMFRVEQIQYNAKEAMLAANGKCNIIQPTITRV